MKTKLSYTSIVETVQDLIRRMDELAAGMSECDKSPKTVDELIIAGNELRFAMQDLDEQYKRVFTETSKTIAEIEHSIKPEYDYKQLTDEAQKWINDKSAGLEYVKTVIAGCLPENQEFKIVEIYWCGWSGHALEVAFVVPEERGFYKLYLPGKPEFNAYYISSSMAISLSYSINGYCWTTMCRAWAPAELRAKLGQAGFGHRLDMLVAEHMKNIMDRRAGRPVYEDYDENGCYRTDVVKAFVYEDYDNENSYRTNIIKSFDSRYAEKYSGYAGPDYERPDNER